MVAEGIIIQELFYDRHFRVARFKKRLAMTWLSGYS